MACPGARPAGLFVDRDGALLVPDWEAGRPIARFDPAAGSGENRRLRFELVDGSEAASTLARSTTGELWLGSDKGAFVLGQPKELRKDIGAVRFSEPGPDGVMWFSTQSERKDSIWRYDPTPHEVTRLRGRNLRTRMGCLRDRQEWFADC
jgi:streptogramin lyase